MNPTGNVTFLFTDIEGSTKLSQDFPEKLHAALERHNEILRNAVESNNGRVFKIVGDAFCCAFGNAEEAVKAAVDIQINLADEKWDEVVIKVRIGIHSGTAEWNGEDYMGYITLARVARILSAAYGEQILISNDTYEHFSHHKDTKTQRENESNSLCLSDLVVKNVCFRDLGERRLKDIIKPIRLYQIVSKGLREEFPPLKTLDARPNNLPVQLTNFIGREDEMKHAKELLKNNRLLTLTGSGGAGKTRFSLQTGAELIDEFAHGVWFIDLAEINDPGLLAVTIINAINVEEEQKKTPEETLIDHLKDKEILLIFDNCEQIINACADLTVRLLTSCPELKIIATSREAFNCAGEQTFRIPPLTQPDPNKINTPEQLIQYESVRLFIERALAVNPKFRVNNENASALAEVCSRLDGIPLAIELAAARIKVLSVEKISERLNDRFNLLTGGKRTALPRQQTLRALIDWSYDLLSENERILWSRLSVFSGGWTMEAAEEVCSDDIISKYEILDLLSQLTEKSVIIYDDSKERYRILESIKQYGLEKLSDGNGMFLRHLDYFLDLSKRAESELSNENEKFWLDVIDADHNNFISSIEWSAGNEIPDKGSVLAASLLNYWNTTGNYSTAIRLVENILQSSGSIDKSIKAKLILRTGNFKRFQGDFEQAKKYSEESLTIYKEIGDKKGIAESTNSLGNIANYQGDYKQALKCYKESLSIFKEIDDKRGIAGSIQNLGLITRNMGEYEQAKKYYEESLAMGREIGDKTRIADTINNLGYIAIIQEDFKQAKKYLEESLVLRIETGDKRGTAISLNNLGLVLFDQGEFEQAKKYLEESLSINQEIGNKSGVVDSMSNLGNIAVGMGDLKKAIRFYKESLGINIEIGDKKE
ncbi:MAG: tetratricopeptide repeat protein [Ignavibacteria bacterium]